MEVKPGYEQTEVGVIPEEWEVKSLGEIGNFGKGIGLLKEDIKSAGSTPAIPYTALYTDFSEIISYNQIKWFVDDITRTYVVSQPCLLIASSSNMAANTGKASALTGTMPVAIGREVIIFKTSSNCVYISYLLSTPLYRRKTLSLARGTTIKHLYPATFIEYKIGLPSSSEQGAIAQALSDVDLLVGGLDLLIAKKRAIKQATMQQLLTGKTRLPGFHGEWKRKHLDYVAHIISGGTPKTTEPSYWNGGIKWCTPTDITGCKGKYLVETERTISRVGLKSSGARMLPAGALLLCSRATIGEIKIAGSEVCTNQGFKSLLCKSGMNNEYLYYKMLTFKQQMVERAFGSTFLEISKTNIASLAFSLPDLPEQTAIAEVLIEMDEELSALKQRREKTHAIKQGMMQQLLTGRVRLVRPQQSEVNA